MWNYCKNCKKMKFLFFLQIDLLIAMLWRKSIQRPKNWIFLFLLTDFCQGHSCHSRSLFLVICKYVIELYSKAFFKDNFFLYVLPLAFDPVPNIRMRACALLPDLKRLIKLPYDTTLKSSLEACIRKVLVNEKDKDVLFTMKNVGFLPLNHSLTVLC